MGIPIPIPVVTSASYSHYHVACHGRVENFTVNCMFNRHRQLAPISRAYSHLIHGSLGTRVPLPHQHLDPFGGFAGITIVTN